MNYVILGSEAASVGNEMSIDPRTYRPLKVRHHEASAPVIH
jgi:hypothetical protein